MKRRKFINSSLIDNDIGRIELWGDVVKQRPTDWWTGEKIEGNFITLNEFKEALTNIKTCNKIEIHLNSGGGEVDTAITIHNLLKAENKHITCIVDGIAASAAFTIMTAADDVQVYPGSVMMCHEVMAILCGYYNNADLNQIVNANETYNNSAAAMYAEKTGMTQTQCRNLMKKETWMTGQEAIDYGFANTLITSDVKSGPQIELTNKNQLIVNGVKHDIRGLHISQEVMNSIAKQTGGQKQMAKTKVEEFMNYMASFFNKEDDDNKGKTKTNADDNGTADDEAKKKEEEEKQKEEQKNAMRVKVANDAKAEERKRLQEIDSIANSIDEDLVQEAKFGETACDAKELAFRSMQREAQKSNKALEKMIQDTKNSKVNSVVSEPAKNENPTGAEKKNDIKNAVKEVFNKIDKIKEGK